MTHGGICLSLLPHVGIDSPSNVPRNFSSTQAYPVFNSPYTFLPSPICQLLVIFNVCAFHMVSLLAKNTLRFTVVDLDPIRKYRLIKINIIEFTWFNAAVYISKDAACVDSLVIRIHVKLRLPSRTHSTLTPATWHITACRKHLRDRVIKRRRY